MAGDMNVAVSGCLYGLIMTIIAHGTGGHGAAQLAHYSEWEE